MKDEPYKITASDIPEIVRDFKKGKDLQIIAELHGTDKANIKRILKQLGIDVNSVVAKRATTWNGTKHQVNIDMLLKDWNSGVLTTFLASKYGFSSIKTLCKYVSDRRIQGYDFKSRMDKELKASKYRDMIADRENGMDWQRLATKYGYSDFTSARCAYNYAKKKESV